MNKFLTWEADILYQQTKEKWVQEGDRNTKFFHAMSKQRRRRNMIKLTQGDGTIVTDNAALMNGAMTIFFPNIFSASPYCLHEEIFEGYPTNVTPQINRELEAAPTPNEIWEAIKSLPPDSAPGPDGYTCHFFRGVGRL